MKFILLYCVIFLVACSSPPVRFHTLNTPSVAKTAGATPAPFVFNLLPAGIPPQMDIPQLVVRTGNNNVEILENERWLSPIGDEVQAKLSSELAEQFMTQDISGLSSPAALPVLYIRVQIRQLDNWLNQFVKMRAEWSLRIGEQRLVCSTTLQEQASGGLEEILSAQQRILHRLAAAIAAQAKRMNEGGRQTSPECK